MILSFFLFFFFLYSFLSLLSASSPQQPSFPGRMGRSEVVLAPSVGPMGTPRHELGTGVDGVSMGLDSAPGNTAQGERVCG